MKESGHIVVRVVPMKRNPYPARMVHDVDMFPLHRGMDCGGLWMDECQNAGGRIGLMRGKGWNSKVLQTSMCLRTNGSACCMMAGIPMASR